MNLAQLLLRQARVAGDRIAILEGTQPWATHAQWAQRSAGLKIGESYPMPVRDHEQAAREAAIWTTSVRVPGAGRP